MHLTRWTSTFCTLGLMATLVACSGKKETGNFTTGPDDPARKVTKEDTEKVAKVLEDQKAKDIAAGIRSESADPHAGVPGAPPISAPMDTKAASAEATPVGEGGKRISVGGLWAMVPAGWVDRVPSSSMRLAEIEIPAAEGDPEAGTLTVFYFGADQGGSVQMNLDRWYGQFEQPDGRNSKDVALLENMKAGTMDVVMVDLSGTMLQSSMPNAPQTGNQTNWRMLAAIVSSAEGPYFFKATGPNKTMEQNRDKMRQFIGGLTAK